MMNNLKSNPSWPELMTILLARLSVLWLLVLISILLPHDNAAFYAFVAIAFTITIPYSLWLRSKLHSNQLAPLQFLVDLVLVTGLIYFTGGIHSDLTLLYPLVILSAGIVATPRQAAGITLLGILVYLLMIVLLSQNMLIEYLPEGKEAGLKTIYSIIALRIFTFCLFGMASIYISKRCTYFHQHNRDVLTTAQVLLKNIGTAALLLDRQGKILSANPFACKLLKRTEQELSAQKFPDLCLSETLSIPEYYGPSTHLLRTDAPPLPVALHSTDITLPAAALGHSSEKQKPLSITLLSFTDISHSLSLEQQLQQVERITAATQIAGEMAHEIRTPLTAISASVQLLKHYEEKASVTDWLPNSPRKKDRIELFSHITHASEQMDKVIQNFVDFAEFSPSDLLSIIRLDSDTENKSYIGHLNMKAKGLENGQDSDRRRRLNNPQFIE